MAISFVCLLTVILVSCPPPIYNGNYTIDPWNGQPVPYLNVATHTIYNVSSACYYQIGSTSGTWTQCAGSTANIGTMSVGETVYVKDSTGTVFSLGTVAALAGPDLRPGRAYPGFYSGQWYDYLFGQAGQQFQINYSLSNIGTLSGGVNYHVVFYLSTDRIITSGDTQLAEVTLNSSSVGQITPPSTVIVTVPSLSPGHYYIGMIVDPANALGEMNMGDKTTTEDMVSDFYIEDTNANSGGAFKFVNSWGVGGWEYIPDGHYWVTYQAMIASQMQVYFYYYTYNPSNPYKPTVLATFRISDNDLYRDQVKITLGLGSPANPVMTKEFMVRDNTGLLGGHFYFPNEVLSLDISEFAPYINDNQLYLETDNSSGVTGTLQSFSVVYYSDYDPPPTTIGSVNYPGPNYSINGGITDFTLQTVGSLNSVQIPLIQPNPRSLAAGGPLVLEKPGEDRPRSRHGPGRGEPIGRNTIRALSRVLHRA